MTRKSVSWLTREHPSASFMPRTSTVTVAYARLPLSLPTGPTSLHTEPERDVSQSRQVQLRVAFHHRWCEDTASRPKLSACQRTGRSIKPTSDKRHFICDISTTAILRAGPTSAPHNFRWPLHAYTRYVSGYYAPWVCEPFCSPWRRAFSSQWQALPFTPMSTDYHLINSQWPKKSLTLWRKWAPSGNLSVRGRILRTWYQRGMLAGDHLVTIDDLIVSIALPDKSHTFRNFPRSILAPRSYQR